jgi:urea transporter
MLVCEGWNMVSETQVGFVSPSGGVTLDESEEVPAKFVFHLAILNSVSQIFFLNGSALSGFLIKLGILLCSRITAGAMILAIFISSFVLGYLVFEENYWYLDAGYAGFNPALFAAGLFFYLKPSWKLLAVACFGVILTMIVQIIVDVVISVLYVFLVHSVSK